MNLRIVNHTETQPVPSFKYRSPPYLLFQLHLWPGSMVDASIPGILDIGARNGWWNWMKLGETRKIWRPWFHKAKNGELESQNSRKQTQCMMGRCSPFAPCFRLWFVNGLQLLQTPQLDHGNWWNLWRTVIGLTGMGNSHFGPATCWKMLKLCHGLPYYESLCKLHVNNNDVGADCKETCHKNPAGTEMRWWGYSRGIKMLWDPWW